MMLTERFLKMLTYTLKTHLSKINCDVSSHNIDVILRILLINFKNNKNQTEEFAPAPIDSQEHIQQQMVH